MLSFDAMKQQSGAELGAMNRKKEGRRQPVYPESFMEAPQALGCCHLHLHLSFRQTEGSIGSHMKDESKTLGRILQSGSIASCIGIIEKIPIIIITNIIIITIIFFFDFLDFAGRLETKLKIIYIF